MLRQLPALLVCTAIVACSQAVGQSRSPYVPTADAVSASSSGGSGYRVLHYFTKYGFDPRAPLIVVNGTLYGTTYAGGGAAGCPVTAGCGTVFSMTTTGRVRVLHRFQSGTDGAYPTSLIDVKGTLYGTTVSGGGIDCDGNGCGTVFSMSTSGTKRLLYSFHGPDGAAPYASLVEVNGALYGTTINGGAHNGGTAFRISLSGEETVLHSFGKGSDGAFPYSSLIDVNGALYGTTYFGGVHKKGTVFRIGTHGSEQVLYSFGRNRSDGYNPEAGLATLGGTMYGTTLNGGLYQNENGGGGTVFGVTTTGVETVLHNFSGNPDGACSAAGLIAVKGTLYGTTSLGGTNNAFGTVFSVSPTGLAGCGNRWENGTNRLLDRHFRVGSRPGFGAFAPFSRFFAHFRRH